MVRHRRLSSDFFRGEAAVTQASFSESLKELLVYFIFSICKILSPRLYANYTYISRILQTEDENLPSIRT